MDNDVEESIEKWKADNFESVYMAGFLINRERVFWKRAAIAGWAVVAVILILSIFTGGNP